MPDEASRDVEDSVISEGPLRVPTDLQALLALWHLSNSESRGEVSFEQTAARLAEGIEALAPAWPHISGYALVLRR
eukprot:scaffold6400_cov376-Prasinococcus_capsulatus_cf.AAC.3